MINPTRKFVVALVQSAPVLLDVEATVEKASKLIAEAAQQGAQLVLFPEAFIPGYPDWAWVIPAGKKSQLNGLYGELYRNAVTIPDDSTSRLSAAAKAAGIHLVIGISERNSEASNASLFNTMVYFDDQGRIIGKHRKLVPTGGERIIWSQGDGTTLEVFPTPLGRIGGLICWENYMPLARQALYQSGVQIYVAPTWDSSDIWLATMRHIAKEGGIFVLGCCMALRKVDIPERFEFRNLYAADKDWINPGNSCVVSPSGQIIAGPLNMKQEILYAEIDLSSIPASKWILDTAGHYSRPDVFQFAVRKNRDREG